MPAFLPIVFVGYGIVAPEFDYNDYQAVDVEGKIVVYLDGEPISDDEEFFDGPLPTIYSNAESKRRIAFARGCAGTIQIATESYKNWDDVKNDFQFEDVTLAYTVSGNLNILLILMKQINYSLDPNIHLMMLLKCTIGRVSNLSN